LSSWLIVVVVVGLGFSLAVANPGYFNHDEFEILLRAPRDGEAVVFGEWRAPWNAGGDFYRPIGFRWFWWMMWQLGDRPSVVHAADLGVHLATVSLWFAILWRWWRSCAIPVAIVFGLSPCVATSVCWTADSYGRFYMLFLLLGVVAVGGIEGVARARWRSIAAFCFGLLCTGGAALSKEFALLAPLLFAGIGYWRRDRRATWAWAAAGSAVAVALVILPRLVDLQQLSARTADSAHGYAMDPSHVAVNVYKYSAFAHVPWAIGLDDTTSGWGLVAGVAGACGFVAASWWCGRWVALGLHGLAMLCLAPVLVLVKAEPQYLYPAAPALALAWGMVWRRRREVAVLIALVWTVHTVGMQYKFYLDGVWAQDVWSAYGVARERTDVVTVFATDRRSARRAHRMFARRVEAGEVRIIEGPAPDARSTWDLVVREAGTAPR